MSKVYDFKDYDKYLSLKPSFELWVIIVYFLRPLILKASTIQMGRGAKSSSVSGLKDMIYPDDFGFFLAIATTIPVLVVIFAYAKRKPEAPDYIQTLWRNGGKLLVLTAILNIAVVFAPFVLDISHRVNPMGWGQLVIAVCIIAYLLTSKRVRDTFVDFPVAAEGNKPGRK